MTRRCVVTNCPTNKRDAASKKGLIYCFPSITKAEKRKLWTDQCEPYIKNINVDHHGICHLHFVADDFEQEEGAKKLKTTAVPTIGTKAAPTPTPLCGSCVSQTNYEEQIFELRLQLFKANQKIEELNGKVHVVENKLKAKEKLLQVKDNVIAGMKRIINRILSRFTPGQKTLLLNPEKKFVHWSDDDMAKAMHFYSKSPTGYEFARNQCQIPLPAPSSIRQHLAKFNVAPNEAFKPVLNLLEKKFASASPFMKQVAVSLDEMSVNHTFCYDAHLDQVFGGKKNVTVYTVRFLFNDLKEPLMYSFEPSRHQLTYIIKLLHQHGLNVVAVVSDMGPKNQKIWKDLNIGQVKDGVVLSSCFHHPETEENVWWFPDYPHLLKSLRNNMLDSSINLKDGTCIDKTWIQDLIKMQKDELQATYKLGNKHVFLRDKQRQNVRTAFEIFSHSTSTGVRLCLKNRENYESCADFLDLVNCLSDLCNSRICSPHFNPLKCAYGLYYEQQHALLQNAEKVFSTFTIGTRKQGKFAPFQKGFLMHMKSLQGLYDDLRLKFTEFKYIRTGRLNQDYLESMFSTIRSYGGFNNNPTATEFKYRIRKLVLNWNSEELNDGSFLKCAEPSNTNNRGAKPAEWSFSREVEENLEGIDTDIPILSNDVYNFDDLDPDQICREGGREYVAGYIAKKLVRDFPELCIQGANETSRNFFVANLSLGGLTEPSCRWFAVFLKFEEVFDGIHPVNSANPDRFIVKKLCEKLAEMFAHAEIPEAVITYYSRVRTFIRIRTLNKRIENEKFAKQELWCSKKKPVNSGKSTAPNGNDRPDAEDFDLHEELSAEGRLLVSQFVEEFLNPLSNL